MANNVQIYDIFFQLTALSRYCTLSNTGSYLFSYENKTISIEATLLLWLANTISGSCDEKMRPLRKTFVGSYTKQII